MTLKQAVSFPSVAKKQIVNTCLHIYTPLHINLMIYKNNPNQFLVIAHKFYLDDTLCDF